jgi:phosphatidylserine decarboxylase
VYLIFVGALNVGEMVFEFEPSVETNSDAREIKVYEYSDLHVNKGDCLGYFKMGSTVVMISQKDYLELDVEKDKKIRFTDVIARLK